MTTSNPKIGKSGSEIAATQYPEPVWIIPDILPSGLTILAGRPKIGKSWFALQIAQAVSAGGMLFGKPVQQGRVLYLALEDNERRLQERMNKQKWTKKSRDNVTFLTRRDFIQHIGPLHRAGWRHLEEITKDGNYRLVTTDTISRAFIGLKDINDSQETTKALDPLQELAISNNIGSLFIDHQAKPNGRNPNPVDDIFGATAKAAVVDTAMGLYRDPQSNTLRLLAEGREIAPVDITLKFDPMTGCWQSEGNTGQYINNSLDDEIIDVLTHLKTATFTQIHNAIGKDKGNTFKRLENLVDYRGIVIRTGNGRGSIYSYLGNGSV